jgi:hypothetical protein
MKHPKYFTATLLAISVFLFSRGEALSFHSPEQNNGGEVSRRYTMGIAFAGLLSSQVVGQVYSPLPANAAEQDSPSTEARSNLLSAINQGRSEEEVIKAIEKLVPFNPAKQTSGGTWREDLEGEWKLIWSANDDFSPLLRLPKPFKPDSYQYFGKPASLEVGEGRVAQGLTGGFFGRSQLWLSSGIEPKDPKDPYTLEIEPPFRLELGGRYLTGKPKKLVIDAGNDADFRKVNARTTEAQQAPKNIYQQMYVERKGKGSLRISSIIDGDPVIVGAILIHEKL